MTVLALIAGLFIGLTAMLCFVVWQLHTENRSLEAERMRLTNRLFVRQGDVPIYTESDIQGKEVAPARPKPAIRVQSPFAAGLEKGREKLAAERKAAPLPDNIAAGIVKAAEQARNGHG